MGFCWFLGWQTSDTRLARRKLGKKIHPDHGGRRRPMTAMAPRFLSWKCCRHVACFRAAATAAAAALLPPRCRLRAVRRRRAATTASPPPNCRRPRAVALTSPPLPPVCWLVVALLSRCRHHIAAAKLLPTSRFRAATCKTSMKLYRGSVYY